jgi:lambda repressor-like predicted transcriptional regulator
VTAKTATERAKIVAAYKTHGTLRNTASALHLSRETISQVLREEGVLQPRGGVIAKTVLTCPQCGNKRHINPNVDNKPLCRTCRAIETQMEAMEPAVITWAKKPGGVLVAVDVYDPEPDTQHRKEKAA